MGFLQLMWNMGPSISTVGTGIPNMFGIQMVGTVRILDNPYFTHSVTHIKWSTQAWKLSLQWSGVWTIRKQNKIFAACFWTIGKHNFIMFGIPMLGMQAPILLMIMGLETLKAGGHWAMRLIQCFVKIWYRAILHPN